MTVEYLMTGLYIHIPFCVKKCAYCDFYSLPSRSDLIGVYVDAVLQEAKRYEAKKFQTLYLGGGTPSLLGTANLPRLLSGIYRTLDLSESNESTIEVNPESATLDFLRIALMKGIDRLSIGIQSTSDIELRSVGRVHNANQAIRAIMEAKIAGFKSISVDLIAGLPGQSWDSLRHSLETVTRMDIQHLSLYCLSIEEGTPLALVPPDALPSDNEQAELFEKSCEFLARAGFVHYEISNFALPGYECKHNVNYWRGGEYIGLGPAAASHIDGRRYKNRADLDDYLNNPVGLEEEVEVLTPEQKAAEEAMLRLRLLNEGLNIDDLAGKFGTDNIAGLKKRLIELTGSRQLTFDGKIYKLPPDRVMVSNPIFAKVLGD
jgi:oxygen-independent coproporphyrinogen III oxidase